MSTNVQKRDFKKGISTEENRRRREKDAVQIRKEKKEEGIAKKRNLAISQESNSEQSLADQSVSEDSTLQASRIYTLKDIPELIHGLVHPRDIVHQISSLRGFRKLLSIEKNPPVQECIDCGAVPHFVACLQRVDSMELQFEAAWAVTNIASTDRTRLVVECGAVPHLIQLLSSPNADIREQSAWCLGNVAGDGSELRDIVLSMGALEPLVLNVSQPATLSLLRNCTWSLSNFCRGKPQPPLRAIQSALPVLGQLIHCFNSNSIDQETLVDAAWALSYISDGDDVKIQAVVDLNVIPTLVAMLGSKIITTAVPALRTLGNIVSGNDSQTQAVVAANVLPALVPLLSHPKKNIRKETCWMLSNIAAGNLDQLNQLFSVPDLLSLVLVQLSSRSEWDVRKEATWVISNAITAGQKRHVAHLVELGVVGPLCELLDVGEGRVLLIAMEALECVLKTMSSVPGSNITTLIDEAGGVDKLESLQEHENQEVYERAVRIIEKYFGEEEQNESENLTPAISSSENVFSFGLPTGKTAAGHNTNPTTVALANPYQFSF